MIEHATRSGEVASRPWANTGSEGVEAGLALTESFAMTPAAAN